MSEYVTLGEAVASIENLVVSDDMTDLVNKACRRLYSRGAVPGMTARWKVTNLVDPPDTTPGPNGYEMSDGYFVAIPKDYLCALYFLVNGQRRNIIPDTAVANPGGYDISAFIDRGVHGDSERYYGLPSDITIEKFNSGSCDIMALVKRAYRNACAFTDILPFTNVSAIKMACLSSVYEDQNDLERSIQYFNYALEELESDSEQFRGPQELTITYYDPASAEATAPIN